jgi:hypothetical protein
MKEKIPAGDTGQPAEKGAGRKEARGQERRVPVKERERQRQRQREKRALATAPVYRPLSHLAGLIHSW